MSTPLGAPGRRPPLPSSTLSIEQLLVFHVNKVLRPWRPSAGRPSQYFGVMVVLTVAG